MRALKIGRLALLAAALAVAASGCGRKGELDPPGTPADQINRKASSDDKKAVPEDRHFLLDPLL